MLSARFFVEPRQAARRPFVCRRFAPSVFLLTLLGVFFLGGAPHPAKAEEAATPKVYEPGHSRLILPTENWRPAGPWAENPNAGEQEGGLLFRGEALAPTGEKVTDFSLMSLPAIAIPSEVFPQMTKEEQAQLCNGLLDNFTALFARQFGVKPAGAKAMIKGLGGWYAVMLTARFKLAEEDVITNQILYSLPDRVVALTFYTQTPLISIIAEDIAAILDNFEPDTRLAPRELSRRNAGEALDAYIKRVKGSL